MKCEFSPQRTSERFKSVGAAQHSGSSETSVVAHVYTKLRRPTVQSQCSGFRPFVTGFDELYTHILLFTYLQCVYKYCNTASKNVAPDDGPNSSKHVEHLMINIDSL